MLQGASFIAACVIQASGAPSAVGHEPKSRGGSSGECSGHLAFELSVPERLQHDGIGPTGPGRGQGRHNREPGHEQDGYAARRDWPLTRDGRRHTVRPDCALVADHSELLLAAAVEDAGITFTAD